MQVLAIKNYKNNKEKNLSFAGCGLRKIYPQIDPYDSFMLRVSKIHELYVERSGKKNGEPIVFLHGGPGQGIDNTDRRWFNPNFFNAILFDQRGSGKSTPKGEILENTTQDLVSDMEKIRKHLGIDKWSLYGISWGANLALRYASSFPEKVKGMVLRGVTPNPKNAVDWLFKENGSGKFLTEMWGKFKGYIPKDEQDNLLEAYFKRLSSVDPEVRKKAAKVYDDWSSAHLRVDSEHLDFPDEASEHVVDSSKVECYYFMNNCFAEPKDLENLKSIKNIPVEVVQGRWDMIAPPANAFEVKSLMPENPFVHINIVEKAGHSTSDPRITNAEILALDNLQKSLLNS